MKKRRTSPLGDVSPQSPLPRNLGQSGVHVASAVPKSMLVTDGSLSVVRPEEEASNSGLLDLNPELGMLSHRDRIVTPTPETHGARSLAPPPLLGKWRPPRRSVLDSPFAPRNASGSTTSDGVSESNNSVIIHPSEAPAQFEIKEPPRKETMDPEHDKLAARLRRWMHDAMKQHLYETAIFWGRQILMIESMS